MRRGATPQRIRVSGISTVEEAQVLYASTGALLRQWLARGRRLLWFNRAMALVLALTALWMLRS